MLYSIAGWIEKHQQWFRFPLVILMALLAFATALTRPSFTEQIELKLLDQHFKMRGVIPHDPRVVIVAVDDNALTEVGRWPWSRDKIATIVDRILGEHQARALGFDIVFSEEQLNPFKESLRLLSDGQQADKTVTHWLEKHQGMGDIDARLESVLQQYHDRLVPGYFFYPKGAKVPELALENLPKHLALMQNSAMTYEFSEKAFSLIPRLAAIEGNLPRFTAQADAVGFFNFFPDMDGTVRRIPLMVEGDGYIYPSMDMQLLRIFKGWPALTLKVGDHGVESLTLGEQNIRIDPSGSMILNHYGPGYTFQHISAADILADRVPADSLKGAIVLLGVTAVGVFDYRPSPFDSVFPGVEGHAAAISNVLNDEEISRPNILEGVELFAVFFLALLCGRLVIGTGPIVQSISIFGVPLLLLTLSWWLFSSFGIWLQVTYLLLAILLATIPVTLIEYVVESYKRAFIHDAFAHYLAPEVVEGLARNPEMLKLGGEEKYLTAFFSDIAAFSSFSEKLTPTELVHFLNQYLTEMSNIILKNGGTIDKYEGDAIIAFFGAPLDMEDHAFKCVLSAMEQQQCLDRLRDVWIEEGSPEVHIRIGLNSGPMVVGNMGTDTHMNYTMMGDHVNLAARLEGVCKVYRVPILMSRDTYVEVREQVAARFIDRVQVVGRQQPVDLYEPLALRELVEPEVIQRSRQYEKAWGMMHRRHFPEAIKILSHLHKEYPDDGLYEVMLARAYHYAKTPPESGWTGIFVLESK
ncbi:MAG: adenylate/guanylate cyclase domain-containing protein [Mariprofundaceae bacterium]|nr:adenylate/guanylate cyclase domain-containing protein [Mariprofundaceae bacterium]